MLEDLGNLGDFIGGIAVVVTLLYLAVQIRHNTASVQAATIQSAAQVFAELMDMFARDPELLRLYDAGTHDFEGLSKDDRSRFASVMGAMMHRFESLVAQTEQGLLPAESWDGAANRLRGAFALPGTLVWWERGKHVFNTQLQTWVEEQIVDKPPRPPAAASKALLSTVPAFAQSTWAALWHHQGRFRLTDQQATERPFH